MDATLKQALEARKCKDTSTNYSEGYNDGIDVAIITIGKHKPVVRMLTDQELNELFKLWTASGETTFKSAATYVVHKAADIWGLTIGEHG